MKYIVKGFGQEIEVNKEEFREFQKIFPKSEITISKNGDFILQIIPN